MKTQTNTAKNTAKKSRPNNGIQFYREQMKEKTGKTCSQQELADHINACRPEGAPEMQRFRVSLMESGDIIPKPWELEAIAQKLQVTPGHLFTAKKIQLIYEVAREESEE